MKDNLLQKRHQFSCQTSLHKWLDSSDDLFRVSALRQLSTDDLIDYFLSMVVSFRENHFPQIFRLASDQILSLDSVKRVSVSAVNEFSITLSRISLVSDNSKVRISILAEFSNNFSIIELISSQELLWVLMSINFDFGHSVVDSWDLNILRDSIFNPAFHNWKFRSFLEFIY